MYNVVFLFLLIFSKSLTNKKIQKSRENQIVHYCFFLIFQFLLQDKNKCIVNLKICHLALTFILTISIGVVDWKKEIKKLNNGQKIVLKEQQNRKVFLRHYFGLVSLQLN